MINLSKFLMLLLALTSTLFFSQKHEYFDDVQNFKKLNTENPSQKDAILFLGSSSFTRWTDVAQYFPDKVIINRAFGGVFSASNFLKC